MYRRVSTESTDDEDEKESLIQEQEAKRWDVFKDPPRRYDQGSTAESKWMDLSVKVLKIVTYIVVFSVVLGSAILSKGTLLFMTSQVKKNVTRPYCNENVDIDQQFIVSVPDVERTLWIWLLIFAFFIPEAGTCFRSIRILMFKRWERPGFLEFLSIALSESLSTIGMAIFVFCVLPELDVVKGAMLTNAVCFIPGLLAFISRKPTSLEIGFSMVLDIICLFAQVTAFIAWPLIEQKLVYWMIPVSLLLISAGWWENFVFANSPIPFIKNLGKAKKNFENKRYYIYAYVAVWKCILFFVSAAVIIYIQEGSIDFLFAEFNDAFSDHSIFVTGIQPIIGGESAAINYSEAITSGTGQWIETSVWTPILVIIINVLSTYVCYAFGKFACKVMIQGFSYAFPVNLAVPVLLSGLIAFCGTFNKNECAFASVIPPYLFFNPPPIYFLKDFISHEYSWLWLIWLLSQAWISVHIWNPLCEKLASTEKLYVRPMYDPFLIDQSLALNRRRDDASDQKPAAIIVEEVDDFNKDNITRIYACGTMWHETKEEMMEFLKSIFRLDEDQCANRIVRTYMHFHLPSYYELETHIFFDDAFVRTSQNDPDPHINEFVDLLVSSMDDSASEVHETRIKVRKPKKYVTPYGGRLEWTLPGKTKMIAHLKDKKKIRAKKRWSQVMYMYYLLGHRLMENEELSAERKNTIAENTYILALDGDIDFQPSAVHLLVDYMKKNKGLGAACGRIHPIGSGAMVWYQKFEYAVGHWLQKATEHVFGCVLCSPGCFSLFRGKALMDDSVMKKYTTKASEAVHYVQYDQGEDRWLCTLLLQRGYRVEYSAASDAYTHCPEGFNEFYNQRRRWMPSTTANIMDLLMDYKHTIEINDNISRLYISYQGLLMIGTILGPGTIFLMLVGAFVAVFSLGQWESFFWNLLPILVFSIICATCKSDTQLFFAGVISAIYGLVMTAVLIGVLLEINNDGILAPSSLFFFCIASEFIIAGIIHPKEFNCLKYGIIYYVTVPSMYMLLVIYSVFNMNNVSWGTREVTVVSKQTKEAQKSAKPEPPKNENKILSFFSIDKDSKLLEFWKMCCCVWRTQEEQLWQIQQSVGDLNRKLDIVEMSVLRKLELADKNQDDDSRTQIRRPVTHIEGRRASRTNLTRQPSQISQLLRVEEDSEDPNSSDVYTAPSEEIPQNSWLDDDELSRCDSAFITRREEMFWNELLDKYLHPIDDTENKDKIAKELKDLRDKMVFTFYMLNALFVLAVFLLTLKKDMLHINWPVAPKVNFTYMPDANEVLMYREYLQLEPIGFVFLIFFALLLVIQFAGMCVHRFATYSQIISTTEIEWNFFETKIENLTGEQILEQNPLKIAKKLQKLKGINDKDEIKKEEPVTRRKTVLLRAQTQEKSEPKIHDLDKAYQYRLKILDNPDKSDDDDDDFPVRRDTVTAIRRRTQIAQRRRTELLNGQQTGPSVTRI